VLGPSCFIRVCVRQCRCAIGRLCAAQWAAHWTALWVQAVPTCRISTQPQQGYATKVTTRHLLCHTHAIAQIAPHFCESHSVSRVRNDPPRNSHDCGRQAIGA
jgi:hypothetical protein